MGSHSRTIHWNEWIHLKFAHESASYARITQIVIAVKTSAADSFGSKCACNERRCNIRHKTKSGRRNRKDGEMVDVVGAYVIIRWFGCMETKSKWFFSSWRKRRRRNRHTRMPFSFFCFTSIARDDGDRFQRAFSSPFVPFWRIRSRNALPARVRASRTPSNGARSRVLTPATAVAALVLVLSICVSWSVCLFLDS